MGHPLGVPKRAGGGVIRSAAVAELAQELRRLRDHAGLSLAQLAKHCWCSKSSVERYLNGRIFPSREVVAAICEACGGDTEAVLALWERARAARDGQRPESTITPKQLPQDIRAFTGRAAELATLDALLAEGVARVLTIAGTAGVGKSALAAHWAWRVADRFPDGQLWVNLRGFDLNQPMTPEQALTGMLRALGVATVAIPVELDAQIGLYRSILADRRVLIVLDNASGAPQVRPMLPGAAGCLVLITSRDEMSGLVARDGAVRLRLDLLSLEDAVALLDSLLRPAASTVDRSRLTELAGLCARLPLALRIAAERVSAQPTDDLAATVTAFSTEARLDVLGVSGDPYTAVRAVFSWSYAALSDDAGALFRTLALIPVSDWDAYAAAALADRPVAEAARLLAALSQAHLVESRGGGRFQMHDLLRVYAAELAEAQDAPADRKAARARLLDYYLAAAVSAMDAAFPHERHRRPHVTTAPARLLPLFPNARSALAWLDTERANLLATVAHATEHGPQRYAVQVAATLYRYLLRGAHHADALAMHGHAINAARAGSDRAGEATALNNRGAAYWVLGRNDDALDHYLRALAICHELGDQLGAANATGNVGTVYERWGRYQEAYEHHQQDLTIRRAIGDVSGEAGALAHLGRVYLSWARYQEAYDNYRESLELRRQLGDRGGEASALDNLGDIYERWGRYEDAFGVYTQALVIAKEVGHRLLESIAHSDLARVHVHWGRYEEAHANGTAALTIAGEIGDQIAEAYALDSLGALEVRRGQPRRASDYYERQLALSREIRHRGLEIQAINGLGDASRIAGRPGDALGRHRSAYAIAEELGDRHQQARAWEGLGSAHRDLGDHAAAREAWRKALALYTDLGAIEADAVRVALDRLDRVPADQA